MKTLKQYSILRLLLAKRLKNKKREIESIKAKNRYYTCCFGVYDMSKVCWIHNYSCDEGIRIDFVQENGGWAYRIELIDNKGGRKLALSILTGASERLRQLRAYD